MQNAIFTLTKQHLFSIAQWRRHNMPNAAQPITELHSNFKFPPAAHASLLIPTGWV